MTEDFQVRPDELMSPTAKRLWASSTVSAQSIREWIERTIPLLPEALQNIGMLIYGKESRFKGAVWELYWWSTLQKSCTDIDVETKKNPHSEKSVDFIATFPTGKRIALEISTLSDYYESIQNEFTLDDLARHLEGGLYGPYKILLMNPVQFESSFTAFDDVRDALRSWIDEVAFGKPVNPANEPSLRLDLRDLGVVLDFTLMAYDQFGRSRPGIIRFPMKSQKRDERDSLRKRILEKAEKKKSVPDLPLVIAITEVGGFMTGTHWSRATALIGDEEICVNQNELGQIVYADNGIMIGVNDWRNSEISAVILCAADVPNEDFNDFEVWINAGASHPIEPEDFGFDVRYFRINKNCVEEFQGVSSIERWKAIPIR